MTWMMIMISGAINMYRQIIVLEPTIEDYDKEIAIRHHKGYTQVVGSTYVKSIETDISAREAALSFGDVDNFFSLAVKNKSKELVVNAKDPDDFYSSVVGLLRVDFEVNIGSFYLAYIKKNNYIEL